MDKTSSVVIDSPTVLRMDLKVTGSCVYVRIRFEEFRISLDCSAFDDHLREVTKF